MSVNDITHSLYERIKNPFFGLFILAWAIHNWQAVTIMTFGTEMENVSRIEYINTYIYPGERSLWWDKLFWCPLCSATLAFIAFLLLKIACGFFSEKVDGLIGTWRAKSIADAKEVEIYRKTILQGVRLGLSNIQNIRHELNSVIEIIKTVEKKYPDENIKNVKSKLEEQNELLNQTHTDLHNRYNKK